LNSTGWSLVRLYFTITIVCRLCLKRDGTCAETRFHLSPKRRSPFKSAGSSVQSTADSRGVRISFINAGYTTFRGSVRILATHSIRQFPLHFPSRASPCAIRFQTHSNKTDYSEYRTFTQYSIYRILYYSNQQNVIACCNRLDDNYRIISCYMIPSAQ
jgi:hypothetical protein